MILLVINKLCRQNESSDTLSPEPKEVEDYNMSLACYRAIYNDFPRRHYMSCINRNANVSKRNPYYFEKEGSNTDNYLLQT